MILKRSVPFLLLCAALIALGACASDDAEVEPVSSSVEPGSISLSGVDSGGVLPPSTERGSDTSSGSRSDVPTGNGTGATPGRTGPSTGHTESEPIEPDDRPDGSPCRGDVQCAGGICLLDPEWPDGHCTTLVCLDREDCARSSDDDGVRCLQSGGALRNFCIVLCADSEECRDGYTCSPLGEDAGWCAPAGASGGFDPDEPRLQDGEACTRNEECAGGTCRQGATFPGGYCTTLGCASNAECSVDPGFDNRCRSSVTPSYCVRICETPGDCRDGYDCIEVPAANASYCGLPDPEPSAPPTQADGESCARDADCIGGRCLQDPAWPGGYCTTLQCTNFEDCASPDEEDNRCLQQPQSDNYCVRICDTAAECREGYRCQIIGQVGYCSPEPSAADAIDLEGIALPLTCDIPAISNVATVDWVPDEGAFSTMLVPFNPDNRSLIARRIFFRDGSDLRLDTQENSFLTVSAQLLGFTSPIVIPPLNDRLALRDSSESCPAGIESCPDAVNALRIQTNAPSICAMQITQPSPGHRLDLNIYLVGVTGIDAASAPANPMLRLFWEEVNAILGQVDLEVGQVRYFDVSEELEARFAVARQTADIQQLARETRLPGPSADDQLSLNVFFNRGFSFDGSGAIGLSLGIPGPAGLHGSDASGVALTTEFIGRGFRRGQARVNGNAYTAQILVHEIGHYLGLFHTTEQNLQAADPIADTPRCTANFPNGCPDRNNLMFPLAGVRNIEITPGQAFVLQANPLLKPR